MIDRFSYCWTLSNCNLYKHTNYLGFLISLFDSEASPLFFKSLLVCDFSRNWDEKYFFKSRDHMGHVNGRSLDIHIPNDYKQNNQFGGRRGAFSNLFMGKGWPSVYPSFLKVSLPINLFVLVFILNQINLSNILAVK